MLIDIGYTDDEIRAMIGDNPARLVGLDDAEPATESVLAQALSA
jgi:hypothetical protein